MTITAQIVADEVGVLMAAYHAERRCPGVFGDDQLAYLRYGPSPALDYHTRGLIRYWSPSEARRLLWPIVCDRLGLAADHEARRAGWSWYDDGRQG